MWPFKKKQKIVIIRERKNVGKIKVVLKFQDGKLFTITTYGQYIIYRNEIYSALSEAQDRLKNRDCCQHYTIVNDPKNPTISYSGIIIQAEILLDTQEDYFIDTERNEYVD